MMPCPTDEDLVRLVDGALSIEQTERLKAHVAQCSRCREREGALRALIEDVKAPVPTRVDIHSHVLAVMARLDDRNRRPAAPEVRRMWAYAGVTAVAACVLLSTAYLRRRPEPAADTWQARGGELRATLGRDVGVQSYAATGELRPLISGATIERKTPLTAGFRNLGQTPAFLLLFAVDAHQAVHWISPPYSRPEDNPASTRLQPTVNERMLNTTAVLEDVPPGALRIVAVITPSPAHVSDVETLDGSDLSAARLMVQLPGAEVRETLLAVGGDGVTR
jgi:putative zinc finger protein